MVNSLLFYFIFHFSVVLYITHKSGSVANTRWCIICTLNVLEILLQMVMHKVFLRGRRSEVVISRMVCGVCIIIILVENDRKIK